MISKLLYLPIEVKKRCYISKLYLAMTAIKNDFEVVIGSHGGVKKAALNGIGGIYLEKDFFAIRSQYFDKLKKANNSIVYSIDEEGLVYLNEKQYLMRVHESTLKSSKKIFIWGQAQKKVIENNFGGLLKKVVEVGNPRIDILDKKLINVLFNKEINYIRNRYKDYILINTNFGIANGYNSLEDMRKILKKHNKTISEEHLEYLGRFFKYQEKIMKEFLKLISGLAVLKKYNIVVRPHPVENVEFWRKKFKKFSNVYVINKFSAIPWIMNSYAVIHNGCTTAIESYLLRKPVISYQPYESANYDQKLPNSLGVRARNKEEVTDILGKIENIDFFSEEKEKIVKEHIWMGNKTSSELIVEEFMANNFLENPRLVNSSINKALLYFKNHKRKLGLMVKKLTKKNDYSTQKFDILTQREVIRDSKIIKNYIGINEEIFVKQIDLNTFYIKKEG